MTPDAFSPATIVVRSSGLMAAEVDQEIVALNIEKGLCYGLNPVGSRIWHLLENPILVSDICKALIAEYQVDPETCQQEVLALLRELHAEGMIDQPADAKGSP